MTTVIRMHPLSTIISILLIVGNTFQWTNELTVAVDKFYRERLGTLFRITMHIHVFFPLTDTSEIIYLLH